jgi:hypothetical protein
MLSKAGRETLVKSVLSAQPIYHLTIFPPQKWLLQTIDKIRRNFLWRGSKPETCSGGHCLVNWPLTCLPKNKGGLGILDLDRFARGLRLRWLWLRWKSKDRAWTALKLPCDKLMKIFSMLPQLSRWAMEKLLNSGILVGSKDKPLRTLRQHCSRRQRGRTSW